jgi:hypothetical protein
MFILLIPLLIPLLYNIAVFPILFYLNQENDGRSESNTISKSHWGMCKVISFIITGDI